MTSEDGTGNDEGAAYVDDIDPGELIGSDRLEPTPEQHERLKDGLHGDEFRAIKRADRRYLVIGRGGGGPGQRRRDVRTLLDERVGATAFMLEDFGFTSDDVDLWAPAFDVLSAMATYVVGVIEDYDGGHVWELGFLYHAQTRIRDVLWLLKRVYDSDAEMRDRYDNGMAASHLAALEEAAGDRVVQWEEPADIPDAVESIP